MAYLIPNSWDDYGHKTLFTLIVFDEYHKEIHIGDVKIAYIGKTFGWTGENLPEAFNYLAENFYSLGQDADYYKRLMEEASEFLRTEILRALGDVAYDPIKLDIVKNDVVFIKSLMRSVDFSTIEQQFRRILAGGAPLTAYEFTYEKVQSEEYAGLSIKVDVSPESTPPSNVHILIGRNGVGKTTILNNMVDTLIGVQKHEDAGQFTIPSFFNPNGLPLPAGYFSGVVSVSFSAFDPFVPPDDQTDISADIRYCYVGLKKKVGEVGNEHWAIKGDEDLCGDFINSLGLCLSLTAKRARWINAVARLESDVNFADMNLSQLVNLYEQDRNLFLIAAYKIFKRMSSGHSIVLLSITRLIETVDEKTLVLIDEPESHLHPPLLSSFTRALSDLLLDRNGVAIIATHSPVVLQEVPKSCVSVVRRSRLNCMVERPETETFGENVGVLTREVFGLEVTNSGFHNLLNSSVNKGLSYEQVEEEYSHQIGFEGRAILQSMIFTRDLQKGS
ncbi:AAA domain-containing protein, putative AbiEii toxin, Type IV TA system [Ferrimonas sediminum]|uniref:AAA domain-containing protein, putative AbiEii toxin, Type IV TA system n=2 Tax=Ferrimonas sediminum TaxID=718193 RepID=A0A1G8UDR9_9GAMM|nr:AAA domain-containing protein, putative AbiEii toxin, Type IV TA system [Ferrimonas sediminum]